MPPVDAALGARLRILAGLAMIALLSSSCSRKQESPQQRYDAAKALFEQATKQFHNPSAFAQGVEQQKLQAQAAENYEKILRRYPEQTNWCAQALRSLANIRAAQTNLSEAVRAYAAVTENYPGDDWETIQAWKSAADLLWEANRHEDARKFYQKVVSRFDGTNQPSIVRIVVKGSKARLHGGE